MKTTVLFGDSLTAGRIGLAFRRYMPVSTEAHGIEGDTWLGVAQRAQRYLGRFGHTRSALVLQGGCQRSPHSPYDGYQRPVEILG